VKPPFSDFTPTVRNGVPKKKSKAGAIAGIVIGASVLGLAVMAGIFTLVQKRRRVARQQEGIRHIFIVTKHQILQLTDSDSFSCEMTQMVRAIQHGRKTKYLQ
jgi:5-methylthioribose kinase